MEELIIQVAHLANPFPAQIFEKNLVKNEIRFRKVSRTNSDVGMSSYIYYVSSKDAGKTMAIREKIDIDNAISEEKFRNPVNKILPYFALILIAIYIIYSLIPVFS